MWLLRAPRRGSRCGHKRFCPYSTIERRPRSGDLTCPYPFSVRYDCFCLPICMCTQCCTQGPPPCTQKCSRILSCTLDPYLPFNKVYPKGSDHHLTDTLFCTLNRSYGLDLPQPPQLLLLTITATRQTSPPTVPDLPFPLHGTSPGAPTTPPHLILCMLRPILSALSVSCLHAVHKCFI